MQIKYQSRSIERSESGTSRTVVYTGTRQEMTDLMEAQSISAGGSGERVVSAAVSQDAGDLWQCEIRYANPQGSDGVAAPDDSFGKKSAQLSCGMLSVPIEKHEDYRAKWNHYLASSQTTPSVPAWWDTATNAILSGTDAKNYRWLKSLSELPVGIDSAGKTWTVIKQPVKPGVESYDLATYQITESAKFPSPERAGRMIANKLNKIGAPDQTFGISEGNWKCDSASVSWNGKHWVATMTWTRSGDGDGWDTDIYTGTVR